MENTPRLLTKKQASEILGIHPETLMRMCKRGKGPKLVVIGRHVGFQDQHIREFIEQNTSQAS